MISTQGSPQADAVMMASSSSDCFPTPVSNSTSSWKRERACTSVIPSAPFGRSPVKRELPTRYRANVGTSAVLTLAVRERLRGCFAELRREEPDGMGENAGLKGKSRESLAKVTGLPAMVEFIGGCPGLREHRRRFRSFSLCILEVADFPVRDVPVCAFVSMSDTEEVEGGGGGGAN
ncbi:hypothetical protein EDD15DRAFT_2191396 [Pisolithus albus]|nr:hypothetical protein EDD15DRAFT_2191396 [Pisolithus albus]